MANPSNQGNYFYWLTVCQLSLCSQCCFCAPSHVSAGKVFPKKVGFGGCSPPQMWEMSHRVKEGGGALAHQNG